MIIKDGFLLFYGSDEIYSNFFSYPFLYKGIEFETSEKAIMWEKANVFADTGIATRILATKKPWDAKFLGRRVKPFDEEVWKQHREDVYYRILLEKFKGSLRQELLDTGGLHLVEASPTDRIWGIGLDENHPDATIPEKWQGLNLLGKVLMKVRADLS